MKRKWRHDRRQFLKWIYCEGDQRNAAVDRKTEMKGEVLLLIFFFLHQRFNAYFYGNWTDREETEKPNFQETGVTQGAKIVEKEEQMASRAREVSTW